MKAFLAIALVVLACVAQQQRRTIIDLRAQPVAVDRSAADFWHAYAVTLQRDLHQCRVYLRRRA